MKSLATFFCFFAFFGMFKASATEYSCHVPAAFSNYTCSGTVKVQTISELNAYKSNLGIDAKKPGIAKGLLINANLTLNEDLVIATPCMIKTAPNISINSSGSICLNGKRKVFIDEGFNFSGKNLNLESSEDIVVNINSVINAQDIVLLSIGSQEINQAFIKEGAQITAANILLESKNIGYIGRNSRLTLTGNLAIHALGDEEASIRQGTTVEAKKIDVNSTSTTKIANLTTLTASEISLIGQKGCDINAGSVMNTEKRIGNCFLTSLTRETFTVDKNSGVKSLTVTFNAETITKARGFIWTFGDGETQSTLLPTVTHTYTKAGSFTASLMYATKDNYQAQKSAGSLKIDVFEPPIMDPPKGYFTYTQDGTFVYLRGFVQKTQFDIASAYYVIDDNQDNKIYLSNFYANSQSNVEMNTFGDHKITMYVEDIKGQKYNTSMNITLLENEKLIAPIIRFTSVQSAIRTAYIDMSRSFIPLPNENLKNFTIDFGDNTIVNVVNAVSAVHTYAEAGTYDVKVSARFNGITRTEILPVTVSDIDKPIVLPSAGFFYYIYDFAGNVVLTDDTSQSPNGDIISYEWDFGDGVTAYGKQASYFFPPGDHLVTLTVTDIAGVRASQTQLITTEVIGTSLVAAFECWDGDPKELRCDIFALDKLNQITRVKMDWGDGISNSYPAPTVAPWGLYNKRHVYTNYGTYNLRLTVDTSRGVTRNINQQKVILGNPPVAIINCNSTNLLVTCSAQSSQDPSGLGIESYTFDFGDGYISNPSTEGLAQHSYLTSGSFNVKVTVKSFSGLSNSTTTQVITSSPLPQAFIYCFTVDLLARCNAIGINYPQNSPIIYEFDYGDSFIESNNTGISNHLYSEFGNYEVKVTITNGLGIFSNAQTLVMPRLRVNQPPIAKIQCTTQANKIFCDAVSSLDPDGSISNAQWDFGDGTTTNGFFVNHVFEAYGQYIVTFTATDNDFLSTSVTQVVSIDSFAPKVLGSCIITNQLLSCDGSESLDEDGNITEYEWIIEGDKEISGQKIAYEFTTAGQKNISLRLTDNDGNISSKLVESVYITNFEPVALFQCASPDEAHLKCSAETSIDDGRITSYEWNINGNLYNGDKQEFAFSTDGDYIVSLKVIDNMRSEKTSSQTYSLTPSIFIGQSQARIIALESSSHELFYSLQGIVNFQVSNAALSQDISKNLISLNGLVLTEEKINYNFSEEKISIDLDLLDGRNEITFSIIDDNGKTISIDYILYAGSRSVKVNFKQDNGEALQNVTVELTPAADQDTTITKMFNVDAVELHNVPNEDFLIRGNTGEMRGNNVIFKTDTDSALILNSFAAIVAGQNNDFSQGINGWEVKDSSFIFSSNSLVLTPNREGVATLRRTLNASAEKPIVTFKYNIRSSYDDEYFALTMRNKATGETKFDFFSTKDIKV